jgi:arginine repressor
MNEHSSDLAKKIKQRFRNQETMTTQEISDFLQDTYPEVSIKTISWRINQLKKEKLIQQRGRGIYSFDFKSDYEPELSLKSKRAYNKVKPLTKSQLLVWDTQMIDALLGIESSKHWIFMAITKGELDDTFSKVLDFSKKVYLNPDKEMIQRYVLPQEEAIILFPLVTETPILTIGEYILPTLESLLVYSWLNHEHLLHPIGYQIDEIFKTAFKKYTVNKNKLLRLASRRDKRNEIENFLNNLNL